MSKGLIGLILTIIAFLFVVICFFQPWYVIDYTQKSDYLSSSYTNMSDTYYMGETQTISYFHLTYFRYKSEYRYGNSLGMIDYSDYLDMLKSNDYSDDSSISGLEELTIVFNNTLYIFVVVFVLIILALIFSIFSNLPTKYFKIFKNLGFIFNLLVFIFIIIVISYFFLAYGDYAESHKPDMFLNRLDADDMGDVSFWHSLNKGGIDLSMGPGLGWYLMFVPCFLTLASAVLIFLNKSPWMPSNISNKLSSTYQPSYPNPPIQQDFNDPYRPRY